MEGVCLTDTFERLEELLADHDMSLYSLSKSSGISYSTLSETKRRKGQLSVDTIEKACLAMGIRPYEFFMTENDWSELDNNLREMKSYG